MKRADYVQAGFSISEVDEIFSMVAREVSVSTVLERDINIDRMMFSRVTKPYFYIITCIEDYVRKNYPGLNVTIRVAGIPVGELVNGEFEPNTETLYYEFLGLKFGKFTFDHEEIFLGYVETNEEKKFLRKVINDLDEGNVSSVTYDNHFLKYAEDVYDVLKRTNYLRFYFQKKGNDFRKE